MKVRADADTPKNRAGTGAGPSLIPNRTAAAVNLTNHPKPSTRPNPYKRLKQKTQCLV
jgi:hypothetical protein